MYMMKLIDLYIESKQLAWALTTLRSEESRLHSVESALDDNPLTLWKELGRRGLKPYSKATLWTRVVDFYDWCIEEGHRQGPNPYKTFRKKNAKQFKNVYQKQLPEIGFEEARRRIETIKDPTIRGKALHLLSGGLRFAESFTQEDGRVVGKGGKVRAVYAQSIEEGSGASYQAVRRALARLGLKPHTLRKIFASRLVEVGANEFELCEVMGWKSLQTASSYVKARNERVRTLVEKVHGGTEDERQQVPGKIPKAS